MTVNVNEPLDLDACLAEHGTEPSSVLPILQVIQRHYRYLPEAVLLEVVRKTSIAASDLYGIATFYDQFRFMPVGEHTIHVCTGTACHVKGAPKVLEAFRRHLAIPDGGDTDAAGQFTVGEIACLGCCTLAPVVQIDRVTYGHVAPSQVSDIIEDFLTRGDTAAEGTVLPQVGQQRVATFRIGMGSCCQAQGSADVCRSLETSLQQLGVSAAVEKVGCVGMCHQTPLIEAISDRGVHSLYARVKPEDVSDIVRRCTPLPKLARWQHTAWRCLETLWSDEATSPAEAKYLAEDDGGVAAFRGRQQHLAMEHCGSLPPTDLAEYRKRGGFVAFEDIVRRCATTDELLATLETAGLRGRGGAGFPTHRKWRAVAAASGTEKFVIGNGDEGDPGAFMDRMLLESFPFRVIEGMTLAAYAVGAQRGLLYIRAEYPLAVSRIRTALAACYRDKLLGNNIFDSDFSFDLDVKEGAGAFVCGEETALLASIEGKRGTPRLRPPFPATSGLFGKPTLIGNVETYSLVPLIFRRADDKDKTISGCERFASLGTPRSRGTKVFALAGKVRRGGLIEIPMGVTLGEVVEEIGGGVADGKRFKAVQIGGPSGGCLPQSLAGTPIDFESLTAAGGMMGSGGLVVLDEDDCMVDMARYFLRFTQGQSCGRCTFCRIGTRRMLDILDRLCEGHAVPEDVTTLERLAHQVQAASLCGLGRTAPNPILSTLRYFRDEYDSHLSGHCPAGKCTALTTYTIGEKCTGCTLCARSCAVQAIEPLPYQRHSIDAAKCTRCGVCRSICPEKAVTTKNLA